MDNNSIPKKKRDYICLWYALEQEQLFSRVITMFGKKKGRKKKMIEEKKGKRKQFSFMVFGLQSKIEEKQCFLRKKKEKEIGEPHKKSSLLSHFFPIWKGKKMVGPMEMYSLHYSFLSLNFFPTKRKLRDKEIVFFSSLLFLQSLSSIFFQTKHSLGDRL